MSISDQAAFVDYYELLHINPSADASQIRRAYILRAKEHHPDAGGSTEMMQLLNRAYKTLMSSTAKGAYDLLHQFHVGGAASDYHYHDNRQVRDVTDMNDAEIDMFLDDLLAEYRYIKPKQKNSVKNWLNRFL